MSRSAGGRLLTTRSPMEMVPEDMPSSPAIMRSSVDLPQPEGPTSTTNSPSGMSTLTPCSTSTGPKALRTFLIATDAILPPDTERASGAARYSCYLALARSETGDGGFLGRDELQQHGDALLRLLDAAPDRRDDLGRVRHPLAITAEGAGHGGIV